ncbi:hypothetical protein MBAV_005531 [Candidatus Magnetobacterium bavaricum]|uniref:Uncharacterized protein n=1 Tax=Candidatus Magnetobacterium bavaricum TaxID=29290 RepID=A0A0F3GK83_9BACT|nr:hypothetical protein MBAV_005531 [Candidatus Magnetobacterium bavaricum]
MVRKKDNKNKETSTAKVKTGKKRKTNPNTASAVAKDVGSKAEQSVNRMGKAATGAISKVVGKSTTIAVKGAAKVGKRLLKVVPAIGTAGAIVSGALAVKGAYDKHKKDKYGDKGNHQNSGGQSSSGGSGGGEVVVPSYTRDDGTVVSGYTRSKGR